MENFTIGKDLLGRDAYKKEGIQRYYYENGVMRNQATYSNNVLNGQSTNWLPNGKVFRICNYRVGLPDGEAITFYPTGKVKRKEIFKTGVLQEGKCFTNSGADTVFYAYEEQPEFIGGQTAMLEFLKKNITYPKTAIRNGISGLVVVQFEVSATGEIEGANVVKKMGYGLDEEGLRLVGLMHGKFKPARLDGVPINFKYTLPVRFGGR